MSEQDIPPPKDSVVESLDHAPGLVTFAAAMLFLLFILYATIALLEFFQGAWLLLSTGSVPVGTCGSGASWTRFWPWWRCMRRMTS